jgi:hypothetical protein
MRRPTKADDLNPQMVFYDRTTKRLNKNKQNKYRAITGINLTSVRQAFERSDILTAAVVTILSFVIYQNAVVTSLISCHGHVCIRDSGVRSVIIDCDCR